MSLQRTLGIAGDVLLIVAAPKEADAVALAFGAAAPQFDMVLTPVAPGIDLIRSGVGKVNGALAVATGLCPERHRAVLNLGVCGSLPARTDPHGGELNLPVTLTQTVIADVSVYADEGALLPDDGWLSIADAGFPPAGVRAGRVSLFEGMGIPASPRLVALVAPALGPAARVGPIATVSTCSGTDALALAIARRTGAVGEAMEGAAIAHALCHFQLQSPTQPIEFLELRTVSNTTGDRSRQQWDLTGALKALTDTVSRLHAE